MRLRKGFRPIHLNKTAEAVIIERWEPTRQDTRRKDQICTLCDGDYVEYFPDNNGIITLNGEFTAEQLTALTNHMKKYNKE